MWCWCFVIFQFLISRDSAVEGELGVVVVRSTGDFTVLAYFCCSSLLISIVCTVIGTAGCLHKFFIFWLVGQKSS